MTIELTVREVLEADAAFQKMNIAESDMNAVCSFRILKILKDLQEPVLAFTTARDNLIREHGSEIDDNQIQVPPEKLEEYNKSIDALLNEKVILASAVKVSLTMIDFDIKPIYLAALEPLFDNLPG